MSVYYPFNNFEFKAIMESDDLQHKYVAILQNINKENVILVPFGDIYKTHYRDTTTLNSYSHLDTNNLDDKIQFILENTHLIKGGYYNSIYFEMKYLYNFDYFLINSNI
jgi:hypothetical protein